MSWDAFLSYGTLVVATVVTVASLLKDAERYRNTLGSTGKFLLYGVFGCVLLLFLGGIVQTLISIL
jgi:hypothetical protein